MEHQLVRLKRRSHVGQDLAQRASRAPARESQVRPLVSIESVGIELCEQDNTLPDSTSSEQTVGADLHSFASGQQPRFAGRPVSQVARAQARGLWPFRYVQRTSKVGAFLKLRGQRGA